MGLAGYPIAKKWDEDADRITPVQVKEWMAAVGFELKAEFDLFQGAKNPKGTGMPERWFVIYGAHSSTQENDHGNGNGR